MRRRAVPRSASPQPDRPTRVSVRSLLRAALPLMIPFLVIGLTPLPAAAAAGDAKSSLKEAGEGVKDLGRKVGEAGKEVGREVAGVAKQVWYKGKKVSAPLLRDVQKVTRKFWQGVIEGKDRTIEKLREENEKLKQKLAEEGG